VYVIKRLFQAVVKVKAELRSSNKVTNINGCSVFLQVLYLDCIDVGFLKLPHDSFPRIKHLNNEVVKSMILADSIHGTANNACCDFGKSKLRDPNSICYSWTSAFKDSTTALATPSPTGLWEVASSFSRVLGVQDGVAGPLFFAVSEFVKASKHGAVHAASMVTEVLSLIAEPYSRGFCYNAGRDINLQLLHGPYYI